MPSSPRTPTHSRDPSGASLPYVQTSPYDSSPRRYSKTSIHTPTTPQRNSFHRADSIGLDRDAFSGGGTTPASNGLGNLADELAGEWDEEEDEDGDVDMNFQSMPSEADGERGLETGGKERTRDSGVDVTESPSKQQAVNKPTALNLTPPKAGRHRRKGSEYDGSDYGEDSDMDSPGMPAGLVARMDMVDSLARRGTEDNGTDKDAVVKRVVEGLRDLGSQSGVEGGATRLITAHTALSTHLHHQTRLLHSLTYPIFSPLTQPPTEEVIDSLLPLLHTLSDSMPRPTTTAFTSLTALHGSTADIITTLNYLSDTLHMSRQTTTTAARRLKSARELVAEMRKEEEEREEGERWLRRGNWGERLRGRECGRVCGEVVGGFEEVCEGWRKRLVAQAQAEAVGA